MNKKDYEIFKIFLKKESGIELGDNREYFIETRVNPLLDKINIESLTSLIKEIEKNTLSKDIKSKLVNALTTNESFFFRDKKPFDLLNNTILPKLKQIKKEQNKINIWSAAASNGQEIYSIAISILENHPELTKWDLNLIATDINQEVLDYAKAGIYSNFEVNRGMDEVIKNKYFNQINESHWEIKNKIKNMISFQQFNLMNPIKFNQTFDVIFLRNVIIYFDKEDKIKLLERIHQKMHDQSYLILGGSETTQWITDKFERHFEQNATYFKKQSAKKILIVDDESAIADLIQMTLKDEYGDSIAIDLAYDGKEGLAKILENDYSLIISDQNMPHMTGTEMFRSALDQKSSSKDVPKLIVSSYVEDFKSNSSYLDNLFFIDKPFQASQIKRNCNLLLKIFKRAS